MKEPTKKQWLQIWFFEIFKILKTKVLYKNQFFIIFPSPAG
jgi:hypothetical protein